MKHYTVGFVFDPALEKVLLIQKNRPDWQAGKLNGPGGRVEENETPYMSVAREVREETNLDIPPEKWIPVAEIITLAANIVLFGTVYDGDTAVAQTMTDERVEWYDTQRLPPNVISQLTWLIPLCKDKIQKDEVEFVRIRIK